jgi:polyferredoxin
MASEDSSLRALAAISAVSALVLAAVGVYLLATGNAEGGWASLAVTVFVFLLLGFGQWLRKRR